MTRVVSRFWPVVLSGLVACSGESDAPWVESGVAGGSEPVVGTVQQALSDAPLPAIEFNLKSVIGQPSEKEVMLNRIVPYAGFNIGGVHIDRTTTPPKIYVADVGNNRVLGFNGYKPQGTNADRILGQPSGFERGAPNGETPVRRLPTASTLAFFHQPINSPTEEPVGVHMDTDAQGNLYVPDASNNRVLRYNNPFTDGTPGTADDVWGQTTFTSLTPGLDNQSFRLETKFWVKTVGLDIDLAGNLWVADVGNHRVMVFPKSGGTISKQAAFCLGQSDCSSSSTSVLNFPVSVQVATDGAVYVLEGDADDGIWGNGKILKFTGNLTQGYTLAATLLPNTFFNPRAMTLDGTTLWVGDAGNERALKVPLSNPNAWQTFNRLEPGPGVQFPQGFPFVNTRLNLGSFGIDQNDILFGWHTRGASPGTPDYFPGLTRVSKTLPAAGNPKANALMLYPGDNQPTPSNFSGLHGLAHYDYQLFQSDSLEIKVHNDVQFKNGLVAPSFTLGKRGVWQRHVLSADGGYLFVSEGPQIEIFELPITQDHQAPVKTLYSDFNVTWVDDRTPVAFDQISLGTGVAYDAENDVLWVTDEPRHRVLRVNNPLGEAVVDLVLGQSSKGADQMNAGVPQLEECRYCFDQAFTVTLDNFGNLYVVDGSYEGGGNKRVLRFNADKLVPPPNNQIFHNPPPEADAVFAKRNWVVQTDVVNGIHPPFFQHRPNFPVTVAFDRDNHMYLSVDAYGDSPGVGQLAEVNSATYERIYFYERPHLGSDAIEPDKVVQIPFGQASFGHFLLGSPRHFIVQDHSWMRTVQAELFNVPKTLAAFQQDSGANGIVAIEAEHYTSRALAGGHDWSPVTPAGFSGEGAMQATPNSGANVNTGYVTGSPRLDFKVNFTKTGTHYVWARALGETPSDDSFHAGLDGQGPASADRIGNFSSSFTWRKLDMDGGQATLNVPSAGEHTVNVWMREDGFVIDKILLTTSASYVPAGAGPAESPRPTPPADAKKLGITLRGASGHDGNVPEDTLDGNLGTRWSANGNGQWIDYDLGGPSVVDQVKIAFYAGNTRQAFFDVQVSSDGVEYHPVLINIASSGSTLALESFTVPEVPARYLRILGHGNSVNGWNSYTEVEVWGTRAKSKLPAQLFASSGHQSPNVPGNTLDGDLGTRWSADGVGQWIAFDLGSVRTLEYVKLAFLSGNVRRAFFHVEVSNDGTNWTRVESNLASNGRDLEFETFNVQDAGGRYVRLVGLGNSTNSWNSYTEVEFWGR